MLKAILKRGAIVPVDPLPPEWEEGAALEVARASDAGIDIDAWASSMQELCADSPADEEKRMQAAIDEQRRQAKAQTSREMGLSE